MHTVWKGSISFGLVNIPVKMFTATENKDIRFRQIHQECGTPIRYKKVCPNCDREVVEDEIVKGYEYESGKYVIVSKEDLASIASETRKTIEIIDFVNLEQIDPIYFNKTYFLSPHETGDKPYQLLRNAMRKTGKIAIAKVMIRSKESLAAVRIYENCIVMETIFSPDEVRSVELVPGIQNELSVSDSEMSMAVQLIENLATDFEPEKYTDEYRIRLQELIQAKVKGEDVVTAPDLPEMANVVDLMEALQASVEATKKSKSASKRTRTRKEKSANE
ncbi:Ku protein [Pueribacillus sp. YX66]|uniref:non-homologous end joining protein Ku n=1 Tax=Pueribacillus sp. YX66 TaxID=3229242 RepID=UPI00358D8E8E